ncbi:hypothetical protein V7S43_013592 [Phytophthora oleae]|uniref:Uncharacterized protein n=1 Tax=Phytophthora oleae TaxID=2107226 RepID=A0ABD3F7B3_9STRA
MASGSNTPPTHSCSVSVLAPRHDSAPDGASTDGTSGVTGQLEATTRSSGAVVNNEEEEEEEEIEPDDPADEDMADDVTDLGKVRTSPLKLTEALDRGVSKRIASAGPALTPASISLADLCAKEDAWLVGIPAVQRHLEHSFLFQDGYGGLETLIQVKRLATSEKAVLFQFFDESDNLDDHVLTPRGDSLQGSELENLLSGLSFRREMASILTEFEPENFAQRVFWTVSTLRRVAQKLSRVQVELEVQVRRLEMSVRSKRIPAWHLEAEKEEVVRNFWTDILKLMHEHEQEKRGLREQDEDLRQQVEVK